MSQPLVLSFDLSSNFIDKFPSWNLFFLGNGWFFLLNHDYFFSLSCKNIIIIEVEKLSINYFPFNIKN
jgi:hypothetical protein